MVNQRTKDRIAALGAAYQQVTALNLEGAAALAQAEVAEAVHQSNAIEHSSLSLEDTEAILTGGMAPRGLPLREAFEARNLGRIMSELVVEVAPLTIPTLLRWHGVLLSDIQDDAAGRFRRAGEWVRVGAHLGANPEVVPEWIADLLEWHNADDSMWFVDRIARFHLEFEVIHPFADGNGRIGRILVNQQLMALGWPPVTFRDKGKATDYYPLFSGYIVSERHTGMSRLIALLLQESLHKRLTLLTGRRAVPLARWAKTAGVAGSSAANKAKRQTIPAFRLRGKWMIDAGFDGEPDAWTADLAE
jgi:Fic family protein